MEIEDEPETVKELEGLGMVVYTFEDIISKGKSSPASVLTPASPSTACVVCYTSGTTGNPKGAKVSHKALEATIDCMDRTGFELYEDDVYFSFLPYGRRLDFCMLILWSV